MKTHAKFSSSSQQAKSAVGLSLRGFEVLSLVTEERAIRLDLAARILDMKPAALTPIVDRLVEQGLMEQERFLVKERHPWIWPTRSGLRVPGTEYPFYEPVLGQLRHLAGVAVTRCVCVEENPGALWVSERALMREQSRRQRHLADGAFEVDGKRIPVEVELTSKDRYKVASIMAALLDAFGAAHYYCSRQTRGAVEETIRSKGFRNVEVFDVPSFA